jgi:hypothetical protein
MSFEDDKPLAQQARNFFRPKLFSSSVLPITQKKYQKKTFPEKWYVSHGFIQISSPKNIQFIAVWLIELFFIVNVDYWIVNVENYGFNLFLLADWIPLSNFWFDNVWRTSVCSKFSCTQYKQLQGSFRRNFANFISYCRLSLYVMSSCHVIKSWPLYASSKTVWSLSNIHCMRWHALS